MSGMHINQNQSWTVDRLTASATHESGFAVRFITLALPGSPAQESVDEAPLGKCVAPNGREWWIVMTPAQLQATIADLMQKHGASGAQAMMERLSREAGDLWVALKNREH